MRGRKGWGLFISDKIYYHRGNPLLSSPFSWRGKSKRANNLSLPEILLLPP
jgi:hypothetical protein